MQGTELLNAFKERKKKTIKLNSAQLHNIKFIFEMIDFNGYFDYCSSYFVLFDLKTTTQFSFSSALILLIFVFKVIKNPHYFYVSKKLGMYHEVNSKSIND